MMFYFNPFHIYLFIFILWDTKKNKLKSKQKFVFTQQDILQVWRMATNCRVHAAMISDQYVSS